MSFNSNQFRALICKVLAQAETYEEGMYSPGAVELLQLTCATESDYGHHILQNGGPGRGVFSIEPATERWLWSYMRQKRPNLISAIGSICQVQIPSEWCLETRLDYQIMIARIRYLPAPHPIPSDEDTFSLAWYYKKYFNTVAGESTIDKSIQKYKKYCT